MWWIRRSPDCRSVYLPRGSFSGTISMAVPSSCNQLVTVTCSLTDSGMSHLIYKFYFNKNHGVLSLYIGELIEHSSTSRTFGPFVRRRLKLFFSWISSTVSLCKSVTIKMFLRQASKKFERSFSKKKLLG